MAEVTPNLGLKKPLESEFVSIQTLNENMDKVDQSLGPVEDLPTTAKNAAGAISEIYDQLADKPHKQLTLTPGVQIVQGGDVPAILRPTMQGRTLVNLLGRVGNCDNVADWTLYDSNNSKSPDTSNYKYGFSGLRLTIANNSFSIGAAYTNVNVVNGKHYIAISEIRNNDISGGVRVRIYGITSLQDRLGNTIGSGTSFQISFRTYSATATEKVQVYGLFGQNVASANGQFATFDGVRFFEITAAEKSYIDGLTIAEAQAYIVANYPYVDDMKHVNAVYIENKGKNLLPPFSEWAFQNDCNAIGAYEAVINGTSSYKQISCVVNVKPNTEYVASATHNAFIAVYDGAGLVAIKTLQGSQFVSFNSGNNEKVMIILGNATSTGVFTFKNPMLNIGFEPLPFEPQKPSYLYLPDCNLRSNVDGSVADRLYTDGEGRLRVMRRFREIVLDGTVNAILGNDGTGFKVIVLDAAKDASANTGTVIKYDGKVFKTQASSVAFTAADQAWNGNESTGFSGNEIVISISDTDSGWGESYTPSEDEIKAYFWGWKMYPQGGLSNEPYSSGTKMWCRRSEVGLTLTDSRNIAPTEMSPNFKPYRLMYQLTQSVDEPVTYEGSLMLHEGENHVEVGTGIVVREAVSPSGIALDRYHINTNVNGIPKLLKNRPDRIAKVFKNSIVDDWVKGRRNSDHVELSVYGYGYAYIPKGRFDPTAAYSVSYLSLDSYELGIAPQTISAEYAPNIRESIESLVREVVEARTETSVLKNTKAQEQQPQWIAPTLRNGWENYSNTGGVLYTNASYRKNELGYVELKGLVSQGTVGVAAFVLPTGYRPRSYRVFAVHAESGGGTMVHGEVIVFPDGQVRVYASSNVYFGFDGVVFEAEQ